MNGFQYKYGDRPLEGYTIQRAIGRGGFGEVYFALSDSGREVALKAIQGYEQIELRGVSQCMNLKSPHLVTIFDVRHNDEGKPFVIMEYVAGPSLKDLLDESPSGLGVQKAAFFLREMAKGLTFLHDRGIVHRDLKPGNVFYEDGYVKIGDYGLSKAMTASRYSGQTITVGTVHYMAPEIGQGRYDRGVDIYALGCCLYEMLTGNVPYFGSSHGEILMKHLTAEPDLTGIEEPFASAIRKALAKDPNDRFKSAQEMVEAVFGAEHVRNSVSCFSPDSLTLVAGRVAQRVAVGGPGSSADAVRLGPPPRNPAGHGGAGISPASRSPENHPEGGQDARPPSDDPWADFAHRMDQFGQRMGQIGEHIGERMRHVGQRFGGRIARSAWPAHAPGFPADAGEVLDSGVIAFADPKRDPLRSRHRRLLALIAIGATGVGGAFVGADEFARDSALTAWWLALLLTLGATWGLAIAYTFRHKLRYETGLLTHLAFGGMACLMATPFFAICAGTAWSVNEKPIMETGLTVAIALFLVDWRKRTAPGREERMSLGAAFMAGLVAWIISLFTDGADLLAAAVLAGTSLAIQVATPFDPHAIRQPNKLKTKGQWYGVHPANEVPGVPPPVSPYAGPVADRGSPAPARTVEPSGCAPYVSANASGKPVPAWARAIALGAFLLLFTAGLIVMISVGVVHYSDDELAIALSAGLGCMMFSLFALVKGFQRTFHSWWSSLVKPVLLLVLAQLALTTAIVMGNMRLSDDETIIALCFLISPIIFGIVIAALPNRFVHELLTDVTPPPWNGTQDQVSPKGRLAAFVLAILAFIFPVAGMHRFYVGKIGTGILWVLTWGLLGIGTIFDLVLILTGRFRDAQNRRLLIWHAPAGVYAFAPASPAAAPPPVAGVAPLNQEPNMRPNPEPHSNVAEPPAGPSAVWPPSACEPQLAPRQTSALWTLIGWLPISLAILVWLTVTALPILVAAGFPDGPGSAAYFESTFGYEEWPRLLGQLGTILAVGLMLMGVIALVLARKAAGGAHILRAILGTAGLGLCFYGLHAALSFVPWPEVFALSRQNRVGPAIELLLNKADSEWLLFSCCCLLTGTLLLAWPERRRQINEVSGPIGGGR
ncbi:MAG TPA: protein kinase [Phycisphaerae bacterium]|nr:protein kinase [Phycisphaerae bacterium]HOJ53330.1 protein kinase [Phycisphaerae bacterium]HOL27216.1 protein kinase [Phycisphaerae bacterium]HPP21776.1 protein kinase [Phycisphaerae bacterium]HQE42046.1 protein kinase [Phycisphaerae bacterium]